MYKLTQRKKSILETEVRYEYSRSSGPGGQKVNKTETQVAIRFSIAETQLFNLEQKQRLNEKLKNRVNKLGEILIQSDKYRTRVQNQKQCFELLCQSLEAALTREKVRKKTKPSRGAVEKRIQEKKRLSEKKRNRQKY